MTSIDKAAPTFHLEGSTVHGVQLDSTRHLDVDVFGGEPGSYRVESQTFWGSGVDEGKFVKGPTADPVSLQLEHHAKALNDVGVSGVYLDGHEGLIRRPERVTYHRTDGSEATVRRLRDLPQVVRDGTVGMLETLGTHHDGNIARNATRLLKLFR